MTRPHARPGYTLLAVLVVVVVLSLAAYRFSDAMTNEHNAAFRASEAAQAKTFAVSGMYYAAGMLADPDTFKNTLGGNPFDNPTSFSNVTLGTQTGGRQGGRFSLIAVADTFSGSGESRYAPRYGVTDESGKLNINVLIQQDPTGQVLHDALMKLPNMSEEIADAIVDWVDPDDTARANGAESSYYTGLNPPYLPKNGPLASLDELLLVRGVTPALLYGTDRNRNGKLDPAEADGGDFSRGWADFLTVYGREVDADMNGNARIKVNDTAADPKTMSDQLTAALGQELSDYLLAARFYGTTAVGGGSSGSGGTKTTTKTTTTKTTTTKSSGSSSKSDPDSKGAVLSVKVTTATTPTPSTPQTVPGTAADLRAAVQNSLDNGGQMKSKLSSLLSVYNTTITLPNPPNSPPNTPQKVVQSPLNDMTKLKELLPKLLDAATTRTAFEMLPRVNVNTAPPEVMAAVPGLSQDNIDAILAARSNLATDDPATTTGAWLVTQANVPPAVFQALESYITGRTMTYRVHSVGYFGKGGPVARVEAVIDTNQGHPRILYFRDVTDLGRGFDLPR